MSTDKLSAEEYLILKQSLDEITPQRTWVGLTDDEVWDAYEKGMYEEMWFARAIEAKLKEKNGG